MIIWLIVFKMQIEERDAIVLDINWHPSGQYLASVGSDGILHIFEISSDMTQSKLIFSDKRKRSVRRVEWSPDGNLLVTAGFDSIGVIYQFDPQSNPVCKSTETLEEQENEMKSARWSPDGKSIVTCNRNKSIWVWSSEDQECLAVHRGHKADVKDVSFSPDGHFICSVSFDGTFKTWDPLNESGEIQSFDEHEGTVWSLGFNPNNDDVVTVGEDGKAILYAREGEKYSFSKSIQLQKDLQPLYSVSYCDENECWVIAGSERIIFFVDYDLNEITKEVHTNHIGDINCCRQCPTHPNIFATCSDDGTVVLNNI